MGEKILLVDDETNVLQAFTRQLRKDFTMSTASSGKEGLELLISEGPFAVVVSDMQMPEMNGIQFLQRVREKSPDTVRLMLTGNADQGTAAQAVNEGEVFRFLNKPCEASDLAKALIAGVEHHRLITAERDLLENTLNGAIQVMTDILMMVDPTSFGKITNLRMLITEVATELGVKNSWNVELAAMLSNIGSIVLPPEVVHKIKSNDVLTDDESEMAFQVPETSYKLISHIPRLGSVAKMVRYQNKHFDGSGYPEDDVKGEEIPIGSRIIRVLHDYAEQEFSGKSSQEAIKHLRDHSERYDPKVIDVVTRLFVDEEVEESVAEEVVDVTIHELAVNCTLIDDIETSDGRMLAPSGMLVTETILQRLRNHAKLGGLKEPFKVSRPLEEI